MDFETLEQVYGVKVEKGSGASDDFKRLFKLFSSITGSVANSPLFAKYYGVSRQFSIIRKMLRSGKAKARVTVKGEMETGQVIILDFVGAMLGNGNQQMTRRGSHRP